MEQEYLGDGVYAVFDGHSIVLDLRQQDSSRITLDSYVLEKLIAFANLTMLRPTTSENNIDLLTDE